MGYEEVETVLPVDFVTRPDPATEQSTAAAGSELGQGSGMASEVPANPSDKREKKRSGKTIVSLWRTNRKKSRSRKSKKKSGTQSASDDENVSSTANAKSKSKSKSKKCSRLRFRTVRSVDSNSTVVASNTTKSKHVNESTADADVKLEVPATDTSLPAVEEGRHSPTISAGTHSTGDNSCGEDKTKTHEYTNASEWSVEVGDESNQFAMQIPSTPSREMKPKEKYESVLTPASTTKSFFSIIKNARSFGSTESKQAVATVAPAASPATPLELPPLSVSSSDGGASVRTSRSNKSNKSTKSNIKKSVSKDDVNCKALVVAKDNEQDATDLPEAANTNTEALAVVDRTSSAKWVKNVSVSIGGYNASFTVSDPMANLADSVKDAINIVSGDANLCQQAKELDGIHTKDDDEEDERDYDHNPTRLFALIQQRAWSLALMQLQHHPHEAKVWVFRKAKPEKAPNVPDADETKEALTVQHTSLVVHDGSETVRFRWRLLPLHAAIVLGAPSEIIQEIIRAYPDAAKKSDERGSLPVHLAASRLDVDPEGEKVVLQLFGAHPDSIDIQDRKGRTPPELAKLARSRREIKEQRRINACNSSGSQIVTEMSLSEQLNLANNASEGTQGEDDDNRSVNSSLSGRFQLMLRKSKSTDTAFRKKRNKKKKKQNDGDGVAGLSRAKTMDENESVADDATIAESLGPGFAFLKTSKSQEAREWAAPPEGDAEREPSEEESLVMAKKAMISEEYQLPIMALRKDESALNIPLPMSFSMGDDISVPVSMEERQSSIRSQRSSTKSPKSVTIHEELNVDHQAEMIQEKIEEKEDNEGLLVLLEKAAENAGRRGMDVSEFLNVLEDEWVTDVEALRRLDGKTLDELLPLMLSRELQRLIHQADSIDNKFLKDQSRGRSPSKKKRKKRSTRQINKSPSTRGHHHREMPQSDGLMAPICEDGENSHTTQKSSFETKDDKNDQDKCAADPTEEQEEDDDDSVEEDNLILTASKEDLEIRHRHAALIAEARKAFPTRERLEDCINLRRLEVEAAVNCGFNVDKETLARAALADDEVRKLLPLRLILPTMADLVEMVQVLEMHKENAGRDLKLDELLELTSEIEEIQAQIDLERKYLAAKRQHVY